MQPLSDAQILEQYARNHSEAAFGELVARHANLIYPAALRQVRSPEAARDITQTVFIALARKSSSLARKLPVKGSLLGWRHSIDARGQLRHTGYVSDAMTVFRTQVPVRRLRRAKRILHKLGLSPAEAVNMLLAQIEIRKGLPFNVRLVSKSLLSAHEQAAAWTEALAAY